jgi:hypothetical protein
MGKSTARARAKRPTEGESVGACASEGRPGASHLKAAFCCLGCDGSFPLSNVECGAIAPNTGGTAP